jgi:hypothetical protein
VYAGFFESLGHTAIHTRLEPGFVFISSALRTLGFGVIGYQISLFALLLLFAFIACRKYFNHIGGGRGFAMFLTASVTLLFVSPMFMNGAINAVRQGLAAFLSPRCFRSSAGSGSSSWYLARWRPACTCLR